MIADEKTTLYRLFNDDGDLLYVGIAKGWITRATEHARTKAWWSEVATARFAEYPNRGAARAAEAEAIKTEYPLYNQAGRSTEAPQPIREATIEMRAQSTPRPPTLPAKVDGTNRWAYSPAEAANALGCTRQHVHNLIARGEIRSLKIGRARRIPVDELNRILAGGDA